MTRKITIRIHGNGDVTYSLSRDKPFQNYLIEWPNDQVVIVNEKNIQSQGYEKHITSEGYIRLSWITPDVHELTYKKIAKAKGFNFEEVFRTKQDSQGYWFWLELDNDLVIDCRHSLIEWNGCNLYNEFYPEFKPPEMSLISIRDYGLELVFHKDSNLVLRIRLENSKSLNPTDEINVQPSPEDK